MLPSDNRLTNAVKNNIKFRATDFNTLIVATNANKKDIVQMMLNYNYNFIIVSV